MRAIFIGTVEFSRKTLEALIGAQAEIVGVITRESSSFNADFADLTDVCREHSIPFRFFDYINGPESEAWVRELQPDIMYCFGWSRLIKNNILEIPGMGVVGHHPAALPMNRGRHPLIWALFLGLSETASTFFFMDPGADSGDILSQVPVIIEDGDDAGSLYEKVTLTALKQIQDFIPKIKNGKPPRISQDDSGANVWRKRGPADGKIDFRMNSRAINNLVRALTRPYVGAHIEYQGEDISVWKVAEVSFEPQNLEPGLVLASAANTITVKTYDGAVKIQEHDFKELPQVGVYL